MIKFCPQCFIEFKAFPKNKKYCSKKCQQHIADSKRNRGKNYSETACQVCNKLYTPSRAGHKYCSYECKRSLNSANNKEWIKRHPEKSKEYSRRARENLTPDKKLKIKQATRESYYKVKTLVYNAYGNKCNCCGELNIKFLTIDHVNNDGHLDKGTSKRTGHGLYKMARDEGFPDRFQLLCWNCNVGKRNNKGICPHNDPI